MLISEVEQMEKDFAQCQEGHAQLLAENADLRRQLAASQQEAAAGQARERELRDKIVGYFDGQKPGSRCVAGYYPGWSEISTSPYAALDAALAEARREGRDTERQLTKEVIILARQRLRREGAEAERERCAKICTEEAKRILSNRTWVFPAPLAQTHDGEIIKVLRNMADAIRALEADTS